MLSGPSWITTGGCCRRIYAARRAEGAGCCGRRIGGREDSGSVGLIPRRVRVIHPESVTDSVRRMRRFRAEGGKAEELHSRRGEDTAPFSSTCYDTSPWWPTCAAQERTFVMASLMHHPTPRLDASRLRWLAPSPGPSSSLKKDVDGGGSPKSQK